MRSQYVFPNFLKILTTTFILVHSGTEEMIFEPDMLKFCRDYFFIDAKTQNPLKVVERKKKILSFQFCISKSFASQQGLAKHMQKLITRI